MDYSNQFLHSVCRKESKKKITPTAGYYMRRELRLQKAAKEAQAKRKEEEKSGLKKEEPPSECIIS